MPDNWVILSMDEIDTCHSLSVLAEIEKESLDKQNVLLNYVLASDIYLSYFCEKLCIGMYC